MLSESASFRRQPSAVNFAEVVVCLLQPELREYK
jgi:hypothetical protein